MQRDSVGKILFVAFALCVVCSVVVSATAVGLREEQDRNALNDKRRQVLVAAGLVDPEDRKADVQQIFDEQMEVLVIDLETGEPAEGVDPDAYDEREAEKDPEQSVEVPLDFDTGGIKRRARYSKVYLQKSGDELVSVTLPIHGKGLWSTMYGFLSLEADLSTVKGLVYYQHGETPGLGGEVDNPTWRAQWPGKEVFDESGDYDFQVIKGHVEARDPRFEHKADGLSGATITARGVDGMLRYWMGPHGYQPFLDRLRAQEKGDG